MYIYVYYLVKHELTVWIHEYINTDISIATVSWNMHVTHTTCACNRLVCKEADTYQLCSKQTMGNTVYRAQEVKVGVVFEMFG